MFRHWLTLFSLCSAIIFVSLAGCDYAIANAIHGLPILPRLLSSPIFRLPVLQVAGVCLLFTGLFSVHRAGLPDILPKTLVQAGLAMGSVILINGFLLKPLFGRAVPWLYLARGEQGFHFLRVSTVFGSFPSGHAALGTAFATVFWISYPKLRPILVSGLAILGLALMAGEFHYFSDLVAGGFVGANVALVSMALVDLVAARDQRSAGQRLDGSFGWIWHGSTEDAAPSRAILSGLPDTAAGLRQIEPQDLHR